MYSEIARNNRRSALFIGLFFVIWVGIGALAGLIFSALASRRSTGAYAGPPTHYGAGPILAGMAICSVLAVLGILYSLTSGAKMVLRVSGAVPADPQRYQQLHDLVEALALGEGIPTPAVYVIDDPSPNAFATGISQDKAAITYTTGLLALMNREELEGVTGHEMSHIKNHDIRLLLVVSTMIGMAALLASVLWRGAFFASMSRGSSRNSGQLVIVIFVAGLLLAIVGFFFGPLIRLALSRRRESLADASGVALTRNPAGLLGALKKLAANDQPFKTMNHATASMCIDDPLRHHESWIHRLYDTHPPIEERIAELEKMSSGQSV
jgi:heat shock protein HtpX